MNSIISIYVSCSVTRCFPAIYALHLGPGAFGRKTLFPQVATEVGVVNTVSDLEPRLDYDIVRGGNDNDILSLPGSY